MEFNKLKKNRFIKESPIDEKKIAKSQSKKVLTNIEAFQLGEFPENLAEKVNLPKMISENYIDNEIKPKHSKLLKNRPLPEMLENSKLIEELKEVKSPTMGRFYEEKKVDETMKKDKYPNKT
tara:strand:- start:49 stop:414 length:366 start_codon:yes stop_codon:yes gene_type:complete